MAASLIRVMDAFAYAFAAPLTLFGYLTPPDVVEFMTQRWAANHEKRTIRFHRLCDVFVAAEELVFDRDLNVYSPSIIQHTLPDINRARAEVKAAQAGVCSTISILTLLCGKPGISNYGHWLAEILPIAFMSRQQLYSREWRVLLTHIYPWMKAVIHNFLALLGMPRECRVAGDGTVQHVKELVFVTGVSEHGFYYGSVAIDCADELAGGIRGWDSIGLWISRAGERRRLRDEATALTALQEFGWAIIEPGHLPFREQIAFAKGTTRMAGVQGAGLTNLLFMKPSSKLTSFVPAVMPDIFYATWHSIGASIFAKFVALMISRMSGAFLAMRNWPSALPIWWL